MLLSFSIPSMLPMIRAGLRQRAGEDVGSERVKRQTIRKMGPRGRALMKFDPISHTIPYDLELWWKSRSPERERIGVAKCGGGNPPIRVFAIDIWHSFVEPTHAPNYPVIRINGPYGWREGDPTLFWSEGDHENGLIREAHADGFDSPEAFRDYFVPNLNDRFEGIIYKW